MNDGQMMKALIQRLQRPVEIARLLPGAGTVALFVFVAAVPGAGDPLTDPIRAFAEGDDPVLRRWSTAWLHERLEGLQPLRVWRA
jgi:hypothetical protein